MSKAGVQRQRVLDPIDTDDGEQLDWDFALDYVPSPSDSGTLLVQLREVSESPDLTD